MKKLWTVFVTVVLAACTTAGTPDAQLANLRKPDYLRTERNLAMTFPEIQMALFKHAQTCGEGPVFRMNEGETSYASIIESDQDARPWNQRIAVDLTWLQPTWRYESRTRVHVYSFFSDAAITERIDAIFDAIATPEKCHTTS